jgi:hypothetical protein
MRAQRPAGAEDASSDDNRSRSGVDRNDRMADVEPHRLSMRANPGTAQFLAERARWNLMRKPDEQDSRPNQIRNRRPTESESR